MQHVGFSSCGAWVLEGAGSVVAACELLVAVCGILVSRPGVESGPPALGAWSLNHWTAREVPKLLIFKNPRVRRCLSWVCSRDVSVAFVSIIPLPLGENA